MKNSYSSTRYDSNSRSDNLWQAMDHLRSAFNRGRSSRVSRGEVRTAILALLLEQPMYGYQIIQEIEERTFGRWKPSAGSIYPTLQFLAEDGIIQAEEINDRKTYSLTKEGILEAEEVSEKAPWNEQDSNSCPNLKHLTQSALKLTQATAQIGTTGTVEQIEAAVELLDQTRRKLYEILSQE